LAFFHLRIIFGSRAGYKPQNGLLFRRPKKAPVKRREHGKQSNCKPPSAGFTRAGGSKNPLRNPLSLERSVIITQAYGACQEKFLIFGVEIIIAGKSLRMVIGII
jgi:hypothetical protein